MGTVIRSGVLGAVAGVAATLVMSAFMLAARRAGLMTVQAPEQITERSVAKTTGRRPRGAALDVLTAIMHLGFGAACGGMYALLRRRWPSGLPPPVLRGALYGTAIWLTSYWGVLPHLGLMPPPPSDQRARAAVMVVAHWIYGATLDLLPPANERR